MPHKSRHIRKRYRHLYREVSRHGRVCFYVRVGKGRRVRIDDRSSREDFDHAYSVALAEALKIPDPEPQPESPKPKPEKRCVYIVAAEGQDRPVKVGISVDPKSRLHGLSTGNHQRLRLVHIFKMSWENAARVEARVKGRLRDFRISGEWIDLPAEDVIEAVRETARSYNIRFEGRKA